MDYSGNYVCRSSDLKMNSIFVNVLSGTCQLLHDLFDSVPLAKIDKYQRPYSPTSFNPFPNNKFWNLPN